MGVHSTLLKVDQTLTLAWLTINKFQLHTNKIWSKPLIQPLTEGAIPGPRLAKGPQEPLHPAFRMFCHTCFYTNKVASHLYSIYIYCHTAVFLSRRQCLKLQWSYPKALWSGILFLADVKSKSPIDFLQNEHLVQQTLELSPTMKSGWCGVYLKWDRIPTYSNHFFLHFQGGPI